MNIYVLRHGQTDYNLMGKFQGRIDVPINQNGISQVEEAAKEISNIKFNNVYSSPLKRAIQTATIVSKSEIQIDERIIERSFGLLEGKQSINDYENRIEQYKIETIGNLQKRVYNFLDEIIKKTSKNDNILIVTHACVAIMIECYLNEKDYSEVSKYFSLANGKFKRYFIGD